MKKNCVTYLFLLFGFCIATAQTPVAPGGVSGAYLWDMLENEGYFDASKNMFSVPLPSQRGSTFTVFVVYRHIQTGSEQTVWTVEGSGTSLVMTTARLGDLGQFGYINYALENEPQYRIFTYTHSEPANLENRHPESLSFTIGRQPADQVLPVRNFRGFIPEIILYDRVLNPRERRRVESYLAMKYGISLSQIFPTSYLNSNGEIIWNAIESEGFNQNIAAVGRDDGSGLLQKTSTSSREPELLRVNLLQRNLDNNEFLFWANNGGGLHFAPRYGGWKQSDKVWKFSKTRGIEGLQIVQDFDLTYVANRRLGEHEHYALMIDHSGSGDFPFGNVSFVEGTRTGDRLQFSNINWSKDSAGAVFSLVIIPRGFVYNDENCVGCNDDKLLGETSSKNSNFASLHLSPNPTSDGVFWLDMVLHQASDVDVKIYTITGSLISERTLRGGGMYYLYRGHLPHVGTYVVQVVSGGTTEGVRVIRN